MSTSSKKARRKTDGSHKVQDARFAAVDVLEAVLVQGRSLATARSLIDDKLDAREQALAMELVNGVLRWRFRLEALLLKLLSKPLRKKDYLVQLGLLVALYELIELRTPDYAVVHEAVSLVRRTGKQWASGLVNAVLRNFIRNRQELLQSVDEDEVARFSHPRWLIDLVRRDWPEDADRIFEANNVRPPMWLRVNQNKVTLEDYSGQLGSENIAVQKHLQAETALKLEKPMDVSLLPGFAQGLASVQDAAAQLAAPLLGAENGERVLDMCAAPGGKTCHILESASRIQMTAVELEPGRMYRVEQNLDRLDLHAELIIGDATDTDSWWNGQPYDRILIDAPCSASGVIRRHPDIKSLRQPDDLPGLCEIQQQILQQSWRMLKPGGVLLYVTCSVLRQENEQQIEGLLSSRSDAAEIPIEDDWGIACPHGRQLLPGDMDSDGFYYALLKKQV